MKELNQRLQPELLHQLRLQRWNGWLSRLRTLSFLFQGKAWVWMEEFHTDGWKGWNETETDLALSYLPENGENSRLLLLIYLWGCMPLTPTAPKSADSERKKTPPFEWEVLSIIVNNWWKGSLPESALLKISPSVSIIPLIFEGGAKRLWRSPSNLHHIFKVRRSQKD